MGTFWDQIKPELDALTAGPVAHRGTGPGGHVFRFARRTPFGAEYDSNSDLVRQVQAAINALGYQPALTEDGAYGPNTATGVKWLQAQKGLSQDGIIGDSTLQALNIAVPAAQPLVRADVPAIDGLQPVVAQVFAAFSTKFEGYTPFMYADSKGYVTTGIGNKIDPQSQAMGLQWKNSDGSLASQADIAAAWTAVKNAYPGVQSVASQSLTTIRLDSQALATLVNTTLASFVKSLLGYYPNFADLPAPAQLAIASISWAWGPAFHTVWGANGTAFQQAIANKDFASASQIMMTASQHEESINPGIIPRDAANQALFAEAASTPDPTQIFWPAPPSSNPLMAMGTTPLAVITTVRSRLAGIPDAIRNLPATIKANPQKAAGIGIIILAVIGGIVAAVLGYKKGTLALPAKS